MHPRQDARQASALSLRAETTIAFHFSNTHGLVKKSKKQKSPNQFWRATRWGSQNCQNRQNSSPTQSCAAQPPQFPQSPERDAKLP
jgi:hypothetical protein